MAIISTKRIEAEEEAERLARAQAEEYAQRHDSVWQQPPPAYEEANAQQSSSSSSTAALSSPSQYTAQPSETAEIPADVEAQQGQARQDEQQGGTTSAASRGRNRRDNEDAESDESMPLLTNHQRRILKRKMKAHERFVRVSRFIWKVIAIALLFLVVYSLINAVKSSLDWSDHMLPSPDDSDGTAIEDPSWSKPVEAPKDNWISPSLPVYRSTAWFTFPANNSAHFIHAAGTSYTGVIRYAMAEEIEMEEWKKINKGSGIDRIAVAVQADFTQRSMLDYVRVNKMRKDNDRGEGVGIYGDAVPSWSGPTSFLSFRIVVYLPGPSRRSAAGLAYDQSSWIPSIQAKVDNLRLAYEASDIPDATPGSNQNRTTLGHVNWVVGNGVVTMASSVVANGTVSMKVTNGNIRDLVYHQPKMVSIAAPAVDLQVINGPIWLSGVVGTEDIALHTGSGAINVSSFATAKRISITSVEGTLGGYYAPLTDLKVRTQKSDIALDVNLDTELNERLLKSSGLLALLGPEAPKHKSTFERSHKVGQFIDKDVHVQNQLGPIFVRYRCHDEITKLRSNLTSSAGSIEVHHNVGLQGFFDMRTKIGLISIADPNEQASIAASEDPISQTFVEASRNRLRAMLRKVFVVDVRNDWRIGEKLVKGRIWFEDHRWEDGEDAKFAVSSSYVKSDVGSIKAYFA